MRPLLATFLLALALPLAAAAQDIPAVGTDSTFDVATWNIEQFGGQYGPSDNDRQRENVQAIVEQSGIDLWAVQEIGDPNQFAQLLDDLGEGYDGVLATEYYMLGLGYIYRTDVVSVRGVGHILEDYDYEFASRPPLELEANVTVGGITKTMTFIVLHMKASDGSQEEARREEAAQRLKAHIDYSSLGSKRVVVLGDWNDEVASSVHGASPPPYRIFYEDDAHYEWVTLPVELANEPTYCGADIPCDGDRTYDQILITDELFDAYVPASARRYDGLLDALDGTGGACGGEYVCTTSDHLPVYARFDFTTSVASEAQPLPGGLTIGAPAPNPARTGTSVTLRLTAEAPTQARVEVFDALGRRVAMLHDGLLPGGEHTLRFDTADRPAGLYLARIQAEGAAHTFRLVLVR